jgi:hypothetical protein
VTVASAYRSTTDRRRGRIHVAGLALAAFLTGMAAAGQLSARSQTTADDRGGPHQERSSRATAPAASDLTTPGPTTEVDGAPAGFARSEQGAVAAAASFVTTGQALLDMDPLAAEQAVRHMAAFSTADAQVADVLARLAAVRETLAPGRGPIVFRQAPVSWRVDGFSSDRARVAVWSVGVLSREGIAPPQAGWATSTFDLVWERGDWRIAAETVAPGPAPLLDDSAAPATSAQLAASLRGFADFGSGA